MGTRQLKMQDQIKHVTPVISKLFESFLLNKCEEHLVADELGLRRQLAAQGCLYITVRC